MIYSPIKEFGNVRYAPQQGLKKTAFIADDHFLIAEKLGCNEDYLRVAFKDIRYVLVKKTDPKTSLLISGIILLIAVRLLAGC